MESLGLRLFAVTGGLVAIAIAIAGGLVVAIAVAGGLVAGLLGEKFFELGAEFLPAGEVLVTRQQAAVLLSGDERIVLALQGLHHLSDLGTGRHLLVDLVEHLRCGAGERIGRDLQRRTSSNL